MGGIDDKFRKQRRTGGGMRTDPSAKARPPIKVQEKVPCRTSVDRVGQWAEILYLREA
jgi:hypothetical protein